MNATDLINEGWKPPSFQPLSDLERSFRESDGRVVTLLISPDMGQWVLFVADDEEQVGICFETIEQAVTAANAIAAGRWLK